MVTADEAMTQSGLVMEKEDRSRCGVIFGSGIDGFESIAETHTEALQHGLGLVSPFFIPKVIPNMAAGQISIRYGLERLSSCVFSACATDSIGAAFRQVRDGYCEVMFCGGAESAITQLAIAGFTSMKALTESLDPKRASIPFDAERPGDVLDLHCTLTARKGPVGIGTAEAIWGKNWPAELS